MNSRPLRFRAWDHTSHCWMNDWRNEFLPLWRWTGDNTAFAISGACEGPGATIQQFTGLKDSKGVDIYEGDIVRHRWIGDWDGPNVIVYWFGEFRAMDGRTWRENGVPGPEATGNVWYQSLTSSLTASPKVEFEVIGNIFESPHLLK